MGLWSLLRNKLELPRIISFFITKWPEPRVQEIISLLVGPCLLSRQVKTAGIISMWARTSSVALRILGFQKSPSCLVLVSKHVLKMRGVRAKFYVLIALTLNAKHRERGKAAAYSRGRLSLYGQNLGRSCSGRWWGTPGYTACLGWMLCWSRLCVNVYVFCWYM